MKPHLAAVGVAWLLTAAAPLADTLVLQNGRRIQGELIGVYGREIEFEERSGAGRRTMRIPRAEIARIEFEDDNRSSSRDEPPAIGGIPRGMRERQVNV